jgi:hypothetical protein
MPMTARKKCIIMHSISGTVKMIWLEVTCKWMLNCLFHPMH